MSLVQVDSYSSIQVLDNDTRNQKYPQQVKAQKSAIQSILKSSIVAYFKAFLANKNETQAKGRQGTWNIISTFPGAAFLKVIGRFLLLNRSLLSHCHDSIFYYSWLTIQSQFKVKKYNSLLRLETKLRVRNDMFLFSSEPLLVLL